MMAQRARPPERASASLVATSQDVADALGLHVQTVYRLARAGKLPMHKLGHAWMMLKRDLTDLLDDEEGGRRDLRDRGDRDA